MVSLKKIWDGSCINSLKKGFRLIWFYHFKLKSCFNFGTFFHYKNSFLVFSFFIWLFEANFVLVKKNFLSRRLLKKVVQKRTFWHWLSWQKDSPKKAKFLNKIEKKWNKTDFSRSFVKNYYNVCNCLNKIGI